MAVVEVDVSRRFGGVARLYGDAGLAKLQAAHVVVVGVGGVGSWAVEALGRNAIGNITIIDLDNISESNVNRQIHALEGAFGKAKVAEMAERIKSINPLANVNAVEDFLTKENIKSLLIESPIKPPDVVIDCADQAHDKIVLGAFCKANKLPLLMSGSAGGRLDPTRMQVADLSLVRDDSLLAKVRKQLRVHHGFPRGTARKPSAKYGIQCVYSPEPIIKPSDYCETTEHVDPSITGINCAGYGSSVCVTAPFGFTVASLAINMIVK